MLKLLPALLLLSFVSAAADSTPHWVEVRSPHFTVYTDSNEREGRKLAGQFERMRSFYQTMLPGTGGDASSHIVVLALKDEKGFRTLEPAAYLAKGQLSLAGLFLRTQDNNYILLRLDGETEHPFEVVYHEYTHFVLRKADYLPLWLNEGLAEFYQNTDIEDKDVRLGQPSADDILYLRENRLLPLTTLFAVDHSSPFYHDEQKGSVFYAESWALTHMLEVTDFDNKTHRLQDYIHLLATHVAPLTAAQQAFGDLGALEKALDGYVQHGTYKLFQTKQTFTADESSFQAVPVSLSDVNAVRADVLANDERRPEAQALIQTVLHDDPKSALAHQTMGDLAFRDGDIAAAAKWYGEALQLGSDSAMVNFYYGAFSLQTGSAGKDVIEASLKRSIRLDPSLAEAYDALSRLYGMNHENLDAAYSDSLQAIQLDRGNIDYRMNAAQVRMEQQNYDAALSVLRAALTVAHQPEQLNMINHRIADIEHFQAQLAEQAARSQRSAAPGQSSSGIPDGDVSVESSGDRLVVHSDPADTTFPAGLPSGPRHSAKGMLRDVHCFAPKGIRLEVQQADKAIPLYSNDLYTIALSTIGFVTDKEIDACHSFEGMKARVDYTEVAGDKRVAGQIVAIELSK